MQRIFKDERRKARPIPPNRCASGRVFPLAVLRELERGKTLTAPARLAIRKTRSRQHRNVSLNRL